MTQTTLVSNAWRNMHAAMVLGVVLGLGVGGVCDRSEAADITVRKEAEASNPSLAIARFEAGPQLRQRFSSALQRADWFRLVETPSQATYQLTVQQPAQGILELKLERAGQSVVHFRQSATGDNQDGLIFAAIDTLIMKTFGNPGPCRGRLAFVLGRQGKKEIFISNFDGSSMRQVTFNGSISTEPDWGAAGNSLVYTLYEATGTSIVEVDLVKQRQRRLSRFPGLNASAALSPNGELAALTLSLGSRVDLYLLQTKASRPSPRALTADEAVESSPTWSPDGRQICYVSDRLGVPQLFMINASGGTSTRLSTGGGIEAVSPDWSPLGKEICFATRQGRQYGIAVYSLEDSQVRVITAGTGGDWEAPAWLPDGRHLICTRSVGNQRELCLVDSWHGTVQRLTAPAELGLPAVSAVP